MRSRKARTCVAERIRPIREAPKHTPEPLGVDQRRGVVSVFIDVLDGLYAHLPRKRATYGRDPVQRLRALQQRLDGLSEDEFHREMAEIIVDLRDAHTRYIGPAHLHGWVALLPILVECYTEESAEHYVVSKVFARDDAAEDRFNRIGFVEGVEVTHWNGTPIARAVELYADRETGGRRDARKARALESLTLRPLHYSLRPDEEWVTISFTTLGGDAAEVRLEWALVEQADEPQTATADTAAQLAYAGNPAAETARRVKKMLFASDAWYEDDQRSAATPARSVGVCANSGSWLTGQYADAVSARVLDIEGRAYGHLRLWSFDLRDDDRFVKEVVELLGQLPKAGLIVDLRGNPGGLIWAAERLLQLFSPNRIEPTRFSLLATDLTRTMAEARHNQRKFESWRHSLDSAVLNGEPYSRGIPMTPPERCNDIGQVYAGPVVVVVDANTYSAGDLFAAGVVDNRVGTLVSVGEATGAGGANVWNSRHVADALRGTPAELAELPRGISYRVSFRRAMRTGDVAGTGIEDVGIPGHMQHSITKRDLTEDNRDLLEFCGRLLASESTTDLVVEIDGTQLSASVTHLDRIDIYVDGHPHGSLKIAETSGTATVACELQEPWYEIEVAGYVGDVCRQRRLLRP